MIHSNPQRASAGATDDNREKDEISEEESVRSQSPQAKRVKTPSKDSEEEIHKRLKEWKEAAEADRKLAAEWKPPEITVEGQRQAEEALRRASII